MKAMQALIFKAKLLNLRVQLFSMSRSLIQDSTEIKFKIEEAMKTLWNYSQAATFLRKFTRKLNKNVNYLRHKSR